jgi:hypothetical protein
VIRLPPRRLIVGDVARGVLLWGIVHVGVALVTLMAPGATMTVDALAFNPLQILFAMGVVWVVAAGDVRVRGEGVFRANLGVSPVVAPATAALVFLLLEIAVVGPVVGAWAAPRPSLEAVAIVAAR